MKYIEISIETSEAGIELLTGKLYAIGIDNFEIRDPRDVEEIMEKKSSYEWDYINDDVVEQLKLMPKISVYFDDDAEGRAQAEAVKSAISELKTEVAQGIYGENPELGSMEMSERSIDDIDWKDKWKEYFKPFKASEHIVIKPTWENYEASEGENVIEIDPGMAFGTGTHETTSMCLEMIDKYVYEGCSFLDAGCGSGILSIAAALLGASEVVGVDLDEEAVRVSSENFELNHVDNIARARLGDLTKGIGYKADIIAGNLMAELLCMLAEGIYEHLKDDGIFIASGILVEKEEMVLEALCEAGFVLVELEEKGEWCCVVMSKEM